MLAGQAMSTVQSAAKDVKAIALRVAKHVPELLGSAEGVVFARALSSVAALSVECVGHQLHWLFVQLRRFGVVFPDYLRRDWLERVSSPQSVQTLLNLVRELEEAISWDDTTSWGKAAPDAPDEEVDLVVSTGDEGDGSDGDQGEELVVVVSDEEDAALVEPSADTAPPASAAAGQGDHDEAHSPPVAPDSRDAQLAKLQQKVQDLQKQVQTLTAANTTLKVCVRRKICAMRKAGFGASPSKPAEGGRRALRRGE